MLWKNDSNRKKAVPALYEDSGLFSPNWSSLVEKFFRDPMFLRENDSVYGGIFPALDIQDKGDRVIIKAEVPGMEKDAITIRLENNLLAISGEKKAEKRSQEDGYSHIERTFGKFQRFVELPPGIEEEKVNASYKNGVLTIEVPKTEEAIKKGRDIEIN